MRLSADRRKKFANKGFRRYLKMGLKPSKTIKKPTNKAYQEICDKDNYVTAKKVRNVFRFSISPRRY